MNATPEFSLESLPGPVREFSPEWGIVLGSGLGTVVEQLQVQQTLLFQNVNGLPQPAVSGHGARFVFAELAGKRVMIAQGRVHLYEGHPARAVAAGVRFMHALGVSKLILTNAAGAVSPAFGAGQWMMLADHLNLTGTTPLLGGANFFDMSEIYSRRLRTAFAQAAREEAIELHEGVYVGMLGPQYETPAEVRMLRNFGADAVGMSTVIEAIQARALAMEVAGFSCLTNCAAGLGDGALHHGEVLENALAGAEKFTRLLRRGLAKL